MADSRRSETWDAIVVGAGVGGLTTAAYLAANGRRVLVLEAQPVLGGAAQTFRRRWAFSFNTGAHYVGDCSPGAVIPTALRGIGIEDEVPLRRLDADQFDRIVGPDLDFRVPRGWDAFEERLAETFPDEERAVRAVTRRLRRMGEALETLGAPPLPSIRTIVRHARVLPALWDGAMSLQRLFDRHHLSEGARAAIGYIANFILLPRERLPAAVYAYGLHHYVKTGGWHIGGGVAALPHVLARQVRCHGGDIRLRSRVETVLVEDGRVAGVQLVDGTHLRAPAVVSNADIRTTYGDLVPPRHLSARRTRRFSRANMSGCGFSVYLGVDLDLRDHLPAQNVFHLGTSDYRTMLATMFESSREDFDPDRALLWITSHSLTDEPEPGLEGYSSLELTTLTPQNYAFWGLEGGVLDGVDYHRRPAYLAQKQHIEDALVRRALELLPFLEGHIVWQESSTMLSHEDWTLNRYSAWAGLDFSLRNMAMRPGPRTELPGLFLTGASTSSGGAILGTLRGGVETASTVLGRDLWSEVRRGTVFGDGLTDQEFRAPTEPATTREHDLPVARVDPLTDDSVAIELAVPAGLAETFAFRPGQYLTVHGEAAGEEIRRSYSICEPPASGRLRIAVRHVPGGVFSTHALHRLRTGDVLRVAPPRGTFGASDPGGGPRRVAAIAAGSGITPILSILADVLHREPDTTVDLLYGNRTIESIMFSDELTDLRDRHPDRFHVEHRLSRDDAPDRPGFGTGRIDADVVDRHVRALDPRRVDQWLLCGPTGLVDTAHTVLASHDVEPDRVATELFDQGRGFPTLPVTIPPGAVAAVHVTAAGHSSELECRSAAETLLDAGLKRRRDLPYSCMTGTCGTCRAHIRDGEVAVLDVAHPAITEAERAAGFTLTCLTHAVGDRVVVDFDASP